MTTVSETLFSNPVISRRVCAYYVRTCFKHCAATYAGSGHVTKLNNIMYRFAAELTAVMQYHGTLILLDIVVCTGYPFISSKLYFEDI